MSGISHRGEDLKVKEVAEIIKVFRLKMLVKKFINFLDTSEIISSDNHVLHIQEKKNSSLVYQGWVIWADGVTKVRDSGGYM